MAGAVCRARPESATARLTSAARLRRAAARQLLSSIPAVARSMASYPRITARDNRQPSRWRIPRPWPSSWPNGARGSVDGRLQYALRGHAAGECRDRAGPGPPMNLPARDGAAVPGRSGRVPPARTLPTSRAIRCGAADAPIPASSRLRRPPPRRARVSQLPPSCPNKSVRQ